MKTAITLIVLMLSLPVFSQTYLITKEGDTVKFTSYKLEKTTIELRIRDQKERRIFKWQDVLLIRERKNIQYVKPDPTDLLNPDYALVDKQIEGKITLYTFLAIGGSSRNSYIYLEKENVGYKFIMFTNTLRNEAEWNRVKENLKPFFNDDPEIIKLIEGDFKPKYDGIKEIVTKYNSKN